MSKILIKTINNELSSIIPKEELEKINSKLVEAVDLKIKAGKSNIDPVARSERIKHVVEQIKSIKEEIIEKLYENGIEDLEKIKAVASKTLNKIDKAMDSKYILTDNAKSNETLNVDESKEPPPKRDIDKVSDEGNNIETNKPENKPAIEKLPYGNNLKALIDTKFKIALNDKPEIIKNIFDKYKNENDIEGDEYPVSFKKSIIKAYKIYKNIDDYFDIPENVETPSFEEIFDAIESIKDKLRTKKLNNLSLAIEEARNKKQRNEKKNDEKKNDEKKNDEKKNDEVKNIPRIRKLRIP